MVVTAERTPPKKSQFYQTPDHSITAERLENISGATDIYTLLSQLPGVQVVRNGGVGGGADIYIRGQSSLLLQSTPLLLVDDIVTDILYLNMISIHDIAQIDVLKGANASVFGARGGNGVIAIHTKDGSNISEIASQPFHIKTSLPLGYQQPVAFYAPKYETEEQRNNPRPDLRTTIHWQPVVQTDSKGMASFGFYTADGQTSYTVIIEGVCNDGQIIRQEAKLWCKD